MNTADISNSGGVIKIASGGTASFSVPAVRAGDTLELPPRPTKHAELQIQQCNAAAGQAYMKFWLPFEDVRELMVRIELALLEAKRRGAEVQSFQVALLRH